MMKNFRNLIIVMLLVIGTQLSLKLNGQESSNSNKYYGGYGYFMIGYQQFNLDGMNDVLKTVGFPKINNGSTTIGGGGHYLLKNWLIGGEGHGLLGGSVENTSYRVVHAGGYGFFNIGYMLVHTPRFNLYPMLGLGGGNLTLYLKDKSLITDNFEDVLKQPARESIIATGGFLMNLAVSAHYQIMGESNEKGSGGFILGVKVGYMLNMSGDKWYLSNQELINVPGAGMSGPYISIVLGGGGLGKSN